jgi:predicted nucleotidyltransferase/predicted transcriptional regulator
LEEYENVDPEKIREKYEAAVKSFVDKIKVDQNIIAVIVSGSLAYDTVWEKSDIDLTVVIRDQSLDIEEFCIDEDEIVLNVHLITRTAFKRSLEKSKGGGFFHSFITKGKIVYSTEDNLYGFFEDARKIGTDDMELSVFYSSADLINLLHKTMKWVYVKNDLRYAQFYILKAGEAIASMEVCLHQEPPTREAIHQAAEFNPELMKTFYEIPMSKVLTRKEIIETIGAIEKYLDDHLDIISRPVLNYMADGEIKTVTMITRYFKFSSHAGSHIFDYLAEKGVIERVTQTIRLTPKGRKTVDEVAFMYLRKG